MSYPYTIYISFPICDKRTRAIKSFGEIFTPDKHKVFSTVKKAQEFACKFIEETGLQFHKEARHHYLIRNTIITTKIPREFVIMPPRSINPQTSEDKKETGDVSEFLFYDADTYRIRVNLCLQFFIKSEPDTYIENREAIIYILPAGYQPAFIHLHQLADSVKTIPDVKTKAIDKTITQDDKLFKKTNNDLIIGKKNKDGEEPAEV